MLNNVRPGDTSPSRLGVTIQHANSRSGIATRPLVWFSRSTVALENATFRRDATRLMEVVERVLAASLSISPPLPLVDEHPARMDEVYVSGRRAGVGGSSSAPRCADFDLDVSNEGAGFTFDCRGCGHRWRWTPGTAWPPTVVRPRLARTPPPELA